MTAVPAELRIPQDTKGSIQLDLSNYQKQKFLDHQQEFLSIFVKQEKTQHPGNPVQGRYELLGNNLAFTPNFPFESGLEYVARTKDRSNSNAYVFHRFQIGKKLATETAKLLSIYPSANELPENLLRFYFYFNTPMKTGQALENIHLVNADGRIDSAAFMAFKQELWSPDGKRLTLLFDPGRIKRGVSTNRELGPALLEGSSYSLAVSKTWTDVYGQTLGETKPKEFKVGPAYRDAFEMDKLRIDLPSLGMDDRITIHFDRIIDHALVQSMMYINNENGQSVDGFWETMDNERVARFSSIKPWRSGNYHIIFDTRFEDVAGNNPGALLDQKTDAGTHEPRGLIRPFSI